jgi:23S rRNA pseudouridine2605 synthase
MKQDWADQVDVTGNCIYGEDQISCTAMQLLASGQVGRTCVLPDASLRCSIRSVTQDGMRLQKFLAERGVASRRHAAAMIRAGRVQVDGGLKVEPGLHIQPGIHQVCVDGHPVGARQPRRTLMLYKPRGYICSRSDKDGRTVYDLLHGVKERVVPVGRLDRDSEGLLLMSSDGELVDRLTHPRFDQHKTYIVTVSGALTAQALQTLRSRLPIDGYRIQPVEVRVVEGGAKAGRAVLQFVLREGRKRQIRRMCEAVGLQVHRLVRTAIRNLTVAGLKPGQWRDLQPLELSELLRPVTYASRPLPLRRTSA